MQPGPGGYGYPAGNPLQQYAGNPHMPPQQMAPIEQPSQSKRQNIYATYDVSDQMKFVRKVYTILAI